MSSSRLLSRGSVFRATAGVAVAAAAASIIPREALASLTDPSPRNGAQTHAAQPGGPLFRALDEKIKTGMARYHIPGVAVGVLYNGREYVRGYGVTNVDYPLPVDGDTLFRIGSTTKTFTATAVMRLVDRGKLDLDAPDKLETLAVDIRAADGGLRVTGDLDLSLAFYRDDYVLATDPDGGVGRSDFVRGSNGSVAWFRDRGRIYARHA